LRSVAPRRRPSQSASLGAREFAARRARRSVAGRRAASKSSM
jgi:hypothetical protein